LGDPRPKGAGPSSKKLAKPVRPGMAGFNDKSASYVPGPRPGGGKGEGPPIRPKGAWGGGGQAGGGTRGGAGEGGGGG